MVEPAFLAISDALQDTHKSDAVPGSVPDTHKPSEQSNRLDNTPDALSGRDRAEDTHKQLVLDIGTEPTPIPQFERLESSSEIPSFSLFRWENESKKQENTQKKIEFAWAGRNARDIGTVVHQQLQMLAERPAELAQLDIERLTDIARRQLRNMGVFHKALDSACQTVMQAIQNTISDERGRWILAARDSARSEWALTVPQDMGVLCHEGHNEGDLRSVGVQKVVIDRTFVDEAGTRWIVDFKTGDHAGGRVQEFLDSEQARYADQLNRYADIIRRLDERPIRVGLYFPLLKGWREWEPPVMSP